MKEQHNECVVVLVDNGMFRSLAVGFDENEIRAFCQYGDYRPKVFATVSIDKAKEFCNQSVWDGYWKWWI